MSDDRRFELVEKNARRAGDFAKDLALRVWRNDRLFFVALTLMNLFLARRSLGNGIFADNDSVCHYAYLRHLTDEFYPATGTFMGFSPKFNVGIPYLLFNTPPGTYVASAVIASLLHISPLAGLKTCMLIAFCSVPLSAAAIARTFEDEPGDLPKFTALAFSLYSSELFGLEFYFKNGMLNPALAIPLFLGALAMFRHAQIRSLPKSLTYLALGGILFAATLMTHVLSAYMFCVALMAFTLGPGLKPLGANAFKAGTLLAIGGLLSGEWLVPSMVFAAKEDAAYTWLRPPSQIWASLLRGELFSSYPVGFFNSFITQSSSSVVAMLAAVVGIYFAVVKRNAGALSALVLMVISFWIVLGPSYAWGISILPVYDRLLWYRFVTLAAVGLFLLAGYGAWKFSSAGFRYYPLNIVVLGAGAIWSFYVVTQRAVKVHTAAEFPQFLTSVDEVSGWLRDHGDKRGRVFSEFLGQGVVQPPSVNYTRHMIPIQSGFDEASGWIYENNPASQVMQKKGPFWYNPFPMIAEAETYDVKYVVAGSPQFIHALSIDPRWKLVKATPDLELFENTSFTPSLLSQPNATLTHEGYVYGGGYVYDVAIDADAEPEGSPQQALVVRTNYAPVWTATLDGSTPVTLAQNDDGLLAVRLPTSLHGKHTLHLEWSIASLRSRGRKISLVGVAIVLLFFAIGGFAPEAFFARMPPGAVRIMGTVGVVGAFAVLAWRSRKIDLSPIGYGIRGGLAETVPPKDLAVGVYDDDTSSGIVHVVPTAWGPRTLWLGAPARKLVMHDSPCAFVALSPEKNSLIVTGHVESAAAAENAHITLTLTPIGQAAQPACVLNGKLNEDILVPDACTEKTAGDISTAGDLPGVTRGLEIDGPADLMVTSIGVKNGTVVVEGESFQNEYDDDGYDAYYGIGSVERFAANGVTMGADALLEQPIFLKKEVKLEPGKHYALWALTRVLHERFRATRATIAFTVDGSLTGSVDGVSKYPVEFWDRDLRFEWDMVGEISAHGDDDVTIRFARNDAAVAGLADIDQIAFVPEPK